MPVAVVSVSVRFTTSATGSLTVIVVWALPFGIEIGLPPTVAVPLSSETVAAYAAWVACGFPEASCTSIVTVTGPGIAPEVDTTTT